MSFESPVIKFDNADVETEQTNNHPGEHSAFSQLNSARSFVLRDQQRSSSLPTSQIQHRGGGGWRRPQNSYLMNLPEEDRRRRSTGSNFYGGKTEMYWLEGEERGWEYSALIINFSFRGMNIVKGSLEQKTLVMRTATSKMIICRFYIELRVMLEGEMSLYQNIYDGFLPASLNSYRNHSVRMIFYTTEWRHTLSTWRSLTPSCSVNDLIWSVMFTETADCLLKVRQK